jgi:hypothetical protein
MGATPAACAVASSRLPDSRRRGLHARALARPPSDGGRPQRRPRTCRTLTSTSATLSFGVPSVPRGGFHAVRARKPSPSACVGRIQQQREHRAMSDWNPRSTKGAGHACYLST